MLSFIAEKAHAIGLPGDSDFVSRRESVRKNAARKLGKFRFFQDSTLFKRLTKSVKMRITYILGNYIQAPFRNRLIGEIGLAKPFDGAIRDVFTCF